MPTRSPLAVLRGAQVPRVRHAPSVRANAWEDVSDLAKAYGLVLDEWQENVLEAAMGERSDGRWAASTVGISVPRQNGKGALIEARELAGLLLFGEKVIIHSAHEQKTARVGFERILSYFENYDDLRKKTRSVMSALGREHIKLKSGAELHFPARSKGAIRGFSIDCLILDEGQILGDSAWEAIKPTISARPNVQTWVLGTPPTPMDDGAVFERMRKRGLEGKDMRLCWCEWSAPSDADPANREAWATANPALGFRISEEAVADELNELSPAGFARERLGIWDDPETHKTPFPNWPNCVTLDPPADGTAPDALGVDMSHDRVISISGSWVDESEEAFVELLEVDVTGDTGAAVEWIVARAGRRIPVVIDSMSPAASMVPTLKKRKVRVIVTTAADMGKACGGVHDAVHEGRLWHVNQDQLSRAVLGCEKRAIGTAGAWGIDRRDPDTNIAPAVSMILSHFGTQVTKKRGNGRSSSGRRAVLL
jgi:hypothetical protein